MTRRWSPECRGGLGPWAWLEALARAALAEPPEWHPADEELIAIRPKSPEDRRLTLDIQKLWMIKYFSVFLIPLVIIGAGIGVWWRRR